MYILWNFQNYLVVYNLVEKHQLGKCVFMATLFCTWGNCSRSNKGLLMFPPNMTVAVVSSKLYRHSTFISMYFTNTEMLCKKYKYVNCKCEGNTDDRYGKDKRYSI